MCNSSDTCSTLGDYLSSDSPEDDTRALLEERLNKYFFWKAHVGKLQTSLRRTPGFNKGERRPSTNDSTATGSGSTRNSSTAASTNPPKRNFDEGELSIALQRKDMRRGQAPPNKRRRVRGGGSAGSTSGTGRSSGSSSSSGASNLFAAATGANPEALEEDAKTIASMCVPFARADLWKAIELILRLRSQGRPIGHPGRGRARRNVRRSVQRDRFPRILWLYRQRGTGRRPTVPRRRGRPRARRAPTQICRAVRPEPCVRAPHRGKSARVVLGPERIGLTMLVPVAGLSSRAPEPGDPGLLSRVQRLGRRATVPERDQAREGRVCAAD